MKSRAIVLVAALLLGASSTAHGATEFRGHILVGHPVTATPVFAIGDRLAPCDTSSPFNGIDSVWLELPRGTESGTPVTLLPEATLDANGYFWVKSGASCSLITQSFNFPCARRSLGQQESCTVPELFEGVPATHMTVEGYAGTGAFVVRVG